MRIIIIIIIILIICVSPKSSTTRSRNDIDLEYSHTFINSINCLHLPIFRSQAAIVSENPLFSTFPIKKSLSFQT